MAGQVKLTVVGVVLTRVFDTASRTVQATPAPSCLLCSQTRSTCPFPPLLLHLSVTVAPGLQLTNAGVSSEKPQSRLGPTCPRVHGSVTKLPPGDASGVLAKLFASQPSRKLHATR